MKKILLIILIICAATISFAQTTTIFNNTSGVSDGSISARLHSIEIYDVGVVATIELTAIKATRRIDYWCTNNCHITSDGVSLLKISGYYRDNKIHQCGYNHKWGWSNIAKGTKLYYKLYFKGVLPSGMTTISIVDEGTYEWNGYSNDLVHSYCFRDFTIINPRKHYTDIANEYQAKQKIDANNDDICGIYEQIGNSSNYKLACIKEGGNYKLIYLSSSTIYSWWQIGDVKAYLNPSASGIFKADWFMSNKSINKDCYIVFDGLSMVVNHLSGTDLGETKYLKMYPLR